MIQGNLFSPSHASKILRWSDVTPVAEKVFSFWVHQSDIYWAKNAWFLIIRTGLASYVDELGRHMACIRFLCICKIYHDFMYLAYGDGLTNPYENLPLGEVLTDWADQFDEPYKIEDIYLRKLLESEWEPEPEENGLRETALKTLTSAAHKDVVYVLLDLEKIIKLKRTLQSDLSEFEIKKLVILDKFNTGLWQSRVEPVAESGIEALENLDSTDAYSLTYNAEEADEEYGTDWDRNGMRTYSWVEAGCPWVTRDW